MDEVLNLVFSTLAGIVIGLAFHSTLTHARLKYGWVFPWDHVFRCRFSLGCPGFSEDNRTCMSGGGDYCGTWRKLVDEPT